MTHKKTLKRRVRERQAKTGERYTTALSHVRAQGVGPVQAELHDVTEAARLEGFVCRAFASEALWRAERSLGAPMDRFRGVLSRLKLLLEASGPDDAGTRVLRLLLRGERGAAEVPNPVREMVAARHFLAQARAGVRGVSPNARLVAFEVPRGDSQAPLLSVVLASPFPGDAHPPVLWLSALSEREDAPSAGPFGALEDQWMLAGLGGPGVGE